MTIERLTAILRDCAEKARRDEPVSTDARARVFVAMLSGAIQSNDQALGDFLFATVLENEASGTGPVIATDVGAP